MLIGADTPVAWLEANNVRFIEREHLYALGSTEDVVRRVAPDATECSRVPEEALAILLGTPARPARPARPVHRHERSVVGRIKDELRKTVTELTGVFKIPTFDEPHPPRAATGSPVDRGPRAATGSPVDRGPREGRTPRPRLISASQLTRTSAARTPAPKLFAQPAPGRPVVSSETTVEMMSLPAMLQARAAAARGPAQPQAFDPGGDATAVDAPAYGRGSSPAVAPRPAHVPPPPPPAVRLAVGTAPLVKHQSARPATLPPPLPRHLAAEPPARPSSPPPIPGAAPTRVVRRRLGG